MKYEINKIYNGFKLIEKQFIKEIDSTGKILVHEKSGAHLIHIENNDSHKAFTISFKTLPENNKGTAHIVEHAIGCSSEKYPLKDVLSELDRSSLNTSINACTYCDMTMYYCSSKNHKDLINLVKVYLDLVFNPLFLKRSEFFRQEGWHYCIRKMSDRLTYNGVVYNEMQGEYTDPIVMLEHCINESLFPDTIYRYDSGGIPEDIVTLSEKEFLDYYHKNYHPSNCCICLYGDINLDEFLMLFDKEYMSNFKRQLVHNDIPLQKHFTTPIQKEVYYTSESEDKALGTPYGKDYLALSFVVGTALDVELRLALEILEHILLKSAASPLTRVLITENNMGVGLEEVGYDPLKQQPVFSIILKGTKKEYKEIFEKKIFEVLNDIVVYGLDKELLEAAIHTVSFSLKEMDTSGESKGIMFSEAIQNSFLYKGHPFKHLCYKGHLDHIVENWDKGYFENIIEKYFLKNNHRVLIAMEPSSITNTEKEKLTSKKLDKYKKSLSKDELKMLIKNNMDLQRFQETPSEYEATQILPVLSITDIDKNIERLVVKEEVFEGVNILFNPENTDDIAYIHILFDTSTVAQEDIPYLGLLSHMLTYLSTKHYTYTQIENEINKNTGGLNCSINVYADINDSDRYKPAFKISSKIFIDKFPRYIDLTKEIISESCFHEKEKIRELLDYIHYELKRSFILAPEYQSAKRVCAYISQVGMYEEMASGMNYYKVVSDLLDDYDNQFEMLSNKLCQIYKDIINRKNLLISITAQEKYYDDIMRHIKNLIDSIPLKNTVTNSYSFCFSYTREGCMTSNALQSVATGFNFKKSGYPFSGALHVATNILNSTYLWDHIRLRGGAYGCDLTIDRNGHVILCSYSDPHLIRTLKTYEQIANFLSSIELTKKELDSYIIGTIGALDMPLSFEQKSHRVYIDKLCNYTNEILEKERFEVLSTTTQDIKSLAMFFKPLEVLDNYFVIGSEGKIRSHKNIFDHVITI